VCVCVSVGEEDLASQSIARFTKFHLWARRRSCENRHFKLVFEESSKRFESGRLCEGAERVEKSCHDELSHLRK